MRESGYYWVLFQGEWLPQYYDAEAEEWSVPVIYGACQDSAFECIDENKIERQ